MRLKPGIFCCVLMMLTLVSCNWYKPKTNWNISLYRDDKQPYGAYLAYNAIQSFFPSAYFETLPHSFRFTSMKPDMFYNENGSSLMVLEGLDFNLSDKEWNTLKRFVNNGNDLFIFCRYLDPKIASFLNVTLIDNYREEYPSSGLDSGNAANNLYLADAPENNFTFKGRSVKGNFILGKYYENKSQAVDTANINDHFENNDGLTPGKNDVTLTNPEASIIGYYNHSPDCVCYSLGKGHIILHAAPLVMSNYFLLQDSNIKYLSAIFSSLPDNINRVYFNDYYKRTAERASLSRLFSFPSTRIAIWLAILIVILFLIFETKRRQRIIPVIPQLRNESVAFVETVGRLYYNTGDHHNLAEKMVQQFLEWIRNNYFLNTNILNNEFEQSLSIKSGIPLNDVREIVIMINQLKTNDQQFDEETVIKLYNAFQQFYDKKI